MKFSLSWLKKFVVIEQTATQLAETLTMSGLEVEEMQTIAPPFSKVVVAQVISVEKHPQADRLHVCQVNVGEAKLRQIVCGAPNVRPNIFVPCALPDAILPNGLQIKVSKLRSVESQGMLCSAAELGLPSSQDGLYCLEEELDREYLIPGSDIRQLLDLDDVCYTLKITPNRGDCLSLLGIAREIAALTKQNWQLPNISHYIPSDKRNTAITLENRQDCSVYYGQIIKGVNAQAATPAWLKNCLQRSGIRSISILVDITNYVMLELGQPLHAFDYDHINGDISVRRAKNKEKLLLLNDQEVELDPQVLVIADQTKVLAMAGIMGGAESAITLESSNLLLESAFFHPQAITGQARRFNFSSDASMRFERGVDPKICQIALQRAVQLVLSLCGGEVGALLSSEDLLSQEASSAITLRFSRVKQSLGIDLANEEIQQILLNLGFVCQSVELNEIKVIAPSWRFDINIAEDLIEEIARVYGYNNIPVAPPQGKLLIKPIPEQTRSLSFIRRQIAEMGYIEVVNYSFVNSVLHNNLLANNASDRVKSAIKIANPIASNLSLLRTHLLTGLLENLLYNLNRQQSDVRLFEIGRCFHRQAEGGMPNGYYQPLRIAALAYGGAYPTQWGIKASNVDFFTIKADLEQIISSDISLVRSNHAALHPGRSADIIKNGQVLGYIGELHPQLVQQLDLAFAPVVFEIDGDFVLTTSLAQYNQIPNVPAVVRDLALVLDEQQNCGEICAFIKQFAPKLIEQVNLFDLYTGNSVGSCKKSLAFRIVMRDTHCTLQDSEIDQLINQLLLALSEKFQASLRV